MSPQATKPQAAKPQPSDISVSITGDADQNPLQVEDASDEDLSSIEKATTPEPKPAAAVPAPPKADASKPQPVLTGSDLGKAWDWLNTPLAPWIAKAAHDISTQLDVPTMRDAELDEKLPGMGRAVAMARGMGAGMLEGAGNLAAGFTSPVGLALTLTSLGPEGRLAQMLPSVKGLLSLPSVQALQKAVQTTAGAGFYGHGVYQTATAPDLAGQLGGIAEAATGAVGAAHGLTPQTRATAARAAGIPEPPHPPGTPKPPNHPPYTPPTASLAPTGALPAAEAAAEADAAFARQYTAWLNDPRHNSWHGLPSPEPLPKLPDPGTLSPRRQAEIMAKRTGRPVEPIPTTGGPMLQTEAEVRAAKQKLDLAREAAKKARGEPTGRASARQSLASERGAVGWLDPDAPERVGEPARPEDPRDLELPRAPRWVKSPERGGFWVMPTGDYAHGTTPKDAQAVLKARGLDPFSKTGLATTPAATGMTAPKPGPTSIDRPWTDAPAGGPTMPGFFSTLQRLTDDLPEKGISAKRLQEQINQIAPQEGQWRGVTDYLNTFMERTSPDSKVTKADLQILLDNTKPIVNRIVYGEQTEEEAKFGDSYAIPGGTSPQAPKAQYTNDLLTFPGEVPTNRVEPQAFRNTSHYEPWNIVGTARGQQAYQLPSGDLGVILDEAQSDVHQKASRVYRKEVRNQADAITALMESEGLSRKKATDRLVPPDFGYRSPEVTAQLQEFKRQADLSDQVADAKRADWQELYDAYKGGLRDRTKALATQYGFDSVSDVTNKSYLGSYREKTTPENEGQRYRNSAASAEDLTPEDAAKYALANLVKDAIKALETDPHFLDLKTRADAAKTEYDKAYAAHERIRAGQRDLEQQVQGKVGNLPWKGQDWADLVAKTKILDVATDPTKSFIAVVGGQENADRYNLSQHYSKLRLDPETNTLHLYGPTGHEIRGSFGAGDTRITAPIQFKGPPTFEDLEPYMGEENADLLVDRLKSYTPEMTEGKLRPVRRQTREPESDYRTNDPEDDDRWGTARQRQRARDRWEERERESYAESERDQWSVEEVEVPTDEVDFDSEQTQAWLAAQAQAEVEGYGDVSAHPTLPGIEHPGRPPYGEGPEYLTETKYRAIADWFGEDEREDDQYLFDSEHEAQELIGQHAEEAASNAEIDLPSDEDLYGPDGADLDDHYDPDYDPDADEDEDTPRQGRATEEEDPDHPGMVREPPTYNPARHPALEGLDLSVGAKGMLTFYDKVFKSRIEHLLRPFGFQGEMQRIQIPGGDSRDAYAWIAYLTPEMKAKIAKAGFSLMALTLALQDTGAPQELKDWLWGKARAQALHDRRNHTRPRSQEVS